MSSRSPDSSCSGVQLLLDAALHIERAETNASLSLPSPPASCLYQPPSLNLPVTDQEVSMATASKVKMTETNSPLSSPLSPLSSCSYRPSSPDSPVMDQEESMQLPDLPESVVQQSATFRRKSRRTHKSQPAPSMQLPDLPETVVQEPSAKSRRNTTRTHKSRPAPYTLRKPVKEEKPSDLPSALPSSSKGTKVPRVKARRNLNLQQREAKIRSDPYATQITGCAVVCKGCHQLIKLDHRTGEYYIQFWQKHRDLCAYIPVKDRIALLYDDQRDVHTLSKARQGKLDALIMKYLKQGGTKATLRKMESLSS